MAVITPPRAEPPRYGLLTAARPVEEPRLDPLQWTPESCGLGGVVDGCDDAIDKELDPADNAAMETFNPFMIWHGYTCSTFGADEEERERRARLLLSVHQSRHVEAEFWSGAVAQSASWDNAYLTDASRATIITPGASSSPLVYGLAALEEAIANRIGRGMIHATIPTVTGWYAAQAIRKEGNLLLTAHDTIVVSGAGYDGSGPGDPVDESGETAWAFGTGMVDVRLGPVRITGATPEEGVLRQENLWETRAERLAAVTFDPCAHVAVRVNLCETFCEPS